MNAMAREKQHEGDGMAKEQCQKEGEKPDENGQWRCMQMKSERAAKSEQE